VKTVSSRFRLGALTAAVAATLVPAAACGSSASTTAQLPTLPRFQAARKAFLPLLPNGGP
jgi:hypothetical protein